MKLRDFSKLVVSIPLVLLASCAMPHSEDVLYQPGVSIELAQMRKATYSDLSYNLFFSIPENKADDIVGRSTLCVTLKTLHPLILDFRAEPSQIKTVQANGEKVDYECRDEHIVIDPTHLKIGENVIDIQFVASDEALNRREDLMYTLFVPDRARTLFPCMDQPDLKASYTLTLEIPETWEAVSNGWVLMTNCGNQRKRIKMCTTEPLSTYLFSFVVGKMQVQEFTKDNRTICIYHRETDPKKVAQCKDIADEVFYDIKWQENYTGIAYPFAKYDLIIVPGFQFGGMEHVGATLYNDSRMFLNENATLSERLERSVLIAHETTHMWFGDLVTMKWFDDVWTKEVFANFYGSMIAEPHFPEVNHQLNFMLDYVPSAISEDRTQGTNSIKQELDNLNHAGLMYGNIIYKKSPIVMNMLYRMMGSDRFRQGIQEYLKTYSYSNASWEDLITILDKYTDENLQRWSHVWCNEKGMPEISATIEGKQLVVQQKDPWQRGLCWPQDISFAVVTGNQTEIVTVGMSMDKPTSTVDLERVGEDSYIIPNVDGAGYGFFRIAAQDTARLFDVMEQSEDEILRGSLQIILHENLINRVIAPEIFIKRMLAYAQHETNELLYASALGYINNCNRLFRVVEKEVLETTLWNMMLKAKNAQRALQTFRTYCSVASTTVAIQNIYNIWKTQQLPALCTPSEQDYIKLSYLLALRYPERSAEITACQLARITNPDRRKEYQFVMPSVSADQAVRDSVFWSLLDVKNRTVEPWASTALANLNNTYRQSEAVAYILPALEEVIEIQRTGDIFFPSSWVGALLYQHQSKEAAEAVKTFFDKYPDYPPLLKNKILQRADHLYRL